MPHTSRQPEAEWELDLRQDPEWLRVRRWREKQLMAGGFTELAALRLAVLPGLDYPAAVDMLKHGATEVQVLNLLID